jgi:hypothetical protein
MILKENYTYIAPPVQDSCNCICAHSSENAKEDFSFWYWINKTLSQCVLDI